MGQELSCSYCGNAPATERDAPAPLGVTRERQAGKARLRIIAINDVYKLDNFSRLKTLVQTESKAVPEGNCITTLAGDFLGPSLLSSLDGGCGIVRCLNEIPVNVVCFGNHETDVPYTKLVQRIEEFRGKWLNGNMPDFVPKLPPFWVKDLAGDEGQPDARRVAFTGLCIGGGKFANTYREDAFGGAAHTMQPVLDAAKQVYEAAMSHQDRSVDAVIPLTHQDLKEDIELAETNLFPLVIAGHDHDVYQQTHGKRETLVVKAGMDAEKAAVIDLEWPSDPEEHFPSVSMTLKDVNDFAPDADLAALTKQVLIPVRELEQAVLYELEEGTSVSSVGVKFGDSSMARLVTTAIRDCLESDAAVINSGAVRGNKTYTETISFGDLQNECPYPSVVLVVKMPWEVLRDAIKWSRKPWWDLDKYETTKEGTSALQIDNAMEVNEEHVLVKLANRQPMPGEEFTVACDSRVLQKNEVFKEYCAKHPERVPPQDAGRPVLPILVEYFCGEMWKRLLESVVDRQGSACNIDRSKLHAIFDLWDTDRDGMVSEDELERALRRQLGSKLSSRILVHQMISMVDRNADGKLSEEEVKLGIMKLLREHADQEELQEIESKVSERKARGPSP
eukprot:TRINITY_DN109303_c0_g1_i1.p1 TRINITY_DN109303_c0_g1~~TRINITY_DN109303_c0_g1_i1.p1  ORF type:complete len:628 (+),score=118.47 TRINITY_DN109303_c0_g1_i1:30-1886(+)